MTDEELHKALLSKIEEFKSRYMDMIEDERLNLYSFDHLLITLLIEAVQDNDYEIRRLNCLIDGINEGMEDIISINDYTHLNLIHLNESQRNVLASVSKSCDLSLLSFVISVISIIIALVSVTGMWS